ncbi:MAG: sigma 54-interacting transcriptional regulator, partial [Candidatus Latescibacteria bacterium]|nr:sigma 54-interacting transcriptional regulator [Candidatus Latescibacterota bacterium]
PRWRELEYGLRRTLDQDQLRWCFRIYRAPAGAGRIAEAGSGQRHGLWFTLGVQDRLPSSMMIKLYQDRRRRLWGGTYGKGAWYYDGAYIHSFNLAEGLAGDKLYTIAEDQQGRIWLGTEGQGISCYDGETIETFTSADGLVNDRVDGLLADRRGRLWLWAYGKPLSCIEDGVCRPVTDNQGQAVEQVICVLEDRQGRLWIGTADQGVGCLDGTALHRFTQRDGLAGNQVHCLLEDDHGRLWAGTSKGVGCCEGNTWRTLTTREGLAHDEVVAITEAPPGSLWLSDIQGGLTRFNGQHFSIHIASTGQPTSFSAMRADRQGQLWLCRDDQGVFRWDGERLEPQTTASGLGQDHVRSLIEDQEGNLWFGTWGGGISRYDGACLQHYTAASGLGKGRVEALLEDREGHIWFGTWGGGASCWDGHQLRTFTTQHGLAADHLWCICEDRQGRIWFGTYGGGVSCWDGHSFATLSVADGLSHNSVWCIFEDRRGHLWFGTQGGGASCWDGASFTALTTAEGLPENRVWAIAEDAAGALWFSTFESGVSRWDGERFEQFTTEEGLAHDQVWCMMRDRLGRMWFGTWGGGVSCYDGQAFRNYTTAEGLADDNVRSMWEDREGHLWFGTYGGGVSRFDGQVFQTLSRKDGLIHDAVQEVRQDREERFWIATEAGVTRYTPPRTPPSIHLKDVIAHQRHGAVQELRVPAAQPFVLFEFQGSSFLTRPSQFAYVYRLCGHQEEWRTTYQRRAEYNDLPVGAYTFEVRAVDRDLNYSEILAVQLVVEPNPQQDRIEALTSELSHPQGLEQFVGQSAALKMVLEQIHTVAQAEVTTLILGETGTGKGLVAGAVHALSRRRNRPFIHVNCGAIPDGLVESELFGHEKGAFTGATSRRLGRFELADGGTLFLDEIGDLPLDSQRVLLQVLQEGLFQRVGGQQHLQVDVRVIAATNRDLRQAMQRGQFREDLFFRLNTFVLNLPPLRERREDIPLLVHYFAEQFAHHLNRRPPHIAPRALESLARYDWPGNVRELEHLVQRALLVSRGDTIQLEDLLLGGPPAISTPSRTAAGATRSLDQQQHQAEEEERLLITRALEATNWIIYGDRGAARLLDTHPEKLRRRMRTLGMKRPPRTR